MKLKVVVLNLTEDEQKFLIGQYAKKGQTAVAIQNTVVLETEDTFERCMIWMAIGQQFPDYEIYMSQKRG